MLKHYLTIATRIFWRNKAFTLINTLGLAIGMAAFTLIFLFVQDELKYDRQFPNYHNVYRLLIHDSGDDVTEATHPGVMMPLIINERPEVNQAARVASGYFEELLMSTGDQNHLQDNIVFTDPSI